MMFSEEDGELAVKNAREVIEAKVKNEPTPDVDFPDKFEKKMGVFVTLNRHPSEELRGCIGYPEPVYKLKKAVVKAARNATEDPRFPSLREDELDHIVVEVTLLTPPEEVDAEPSELPDKIVCGEDGLIASKGMNKGLLLPQVPVEQGWDEEQFLAHTCRKARLPPDSWKDGSCTIQKFQGQIFREKEPHGDIEERQIA